MSEKKILKQILETASFSCHMDLSETVDMGFCREYCMYFYGHYGNGNREDVFDIFGCEYKEELA